MKDIKSFISTAIYYVNAKPHLGHALENIQADVIARYSRLLGKNVFFLSGTDENSLKNVQAAKKENISTRELVNKYSENFLQLKNILNLSYDDFIRTTEERHIKGAQKLWIACQKDIYKKKYRGLYCVGCEEFYKEEELENGVCPEHKTKPELIEEENYFFKLSNYKEELKKIISQNKLKIIPESRKNEVLSFINQGLKDICISRSAERANGWGIDVPNDPSQKIWVWLDALSNYINALGYVDNTKKFKEFWQENDNILHVIGKGILRFHAIYWPAFLLSANLSLPKTIFVHGYITSNGQKMSKSLGNVINPSELVKKYGSADAVRYFLLREISSAEDGDFTYRKFEERYNADLASGLGNLVARIMKLAEISNFQFPVFSALWNPARRDNQFSNSNFQKIFSEAQKKYRKLLDEFKFNEALEEIWRLISLCDKYIEEKKPWEKSERQKAVINDLLFALENITQMIKPFLPETSKKIIENFCQLAEGKNKNKILFPKINKL